MRDAVQTPFNPERFEDAIVDAVADLTVLDLVLETAVPDDDASEAMGLPHNPDLHRVVMTHDVHRALMRSVLHLRRSVWSIQAQFNEGGCAAMTRGLNKPAA